ncbi:hypothetical protein ONZ45_g15342 [Pleurotus djamor]|nr:hypothetical protein ONZ45_g15342 [Pleurotus djamor]
MDEIERQSTQPLFSDAFPPRADADLVLKSVDNVYFAVHKLMLALASPIFGDTYVPCWQRKSNRTELITTKKRKPTILDLQTDLLSEDILYCYAFARKNNMEEVVTLAQAAWLGGGTSSLRPKTKANPVVDSMPYGWYRELWDLREKRSNWLAVQSWAIEDTIWQSEDEDDFKVVSLDEEDSRIWKLQDRAQEYPSLKSLRRLNPEGLGFDDDGYCLASNLIRILTKDFEEEFGF